MIYLRSFVYDIHDNCVDTEDDEDGYEDVVNTFNMGNL